MEQRKLFSASFTPVSTLIDPLPADYSYFGGVAASKGDLAAVRGQGGVGLYDASTGSLLRTLTDPTSNPGSQFGNAISFLGSNKIAVSSPLANNIGAVYIFSTDNGALVQTLTPEVLINYNPAQPPAINPGIGTAMAEYNGHLLVGVINDPTVGGSGSVLEVDSSGQVVHQFLNPAPTSFLGDAFGSAIAVSGSHILITAMNGGDSAVYQFDDYNQIGVFSDPTGNSDFLFGTRLAVDGDDLLIGAPQFSQQYVYDGDGNIVGVNIVGSPVYHYGLTSGQLINSVSVPSSYFPYPDDGYLYTGFGMGVAFSGNYMVVGAPQTFDTAAGTYSGDVFAFDKTTGELAAHVSNPVGLGNFGTLVLPLSGGNILITDYSASGTYSNQGAAYVYHLADDSAPLPPPAAAAGADQSALTGDTLSFVGVATPAPGAVITGTAWDFNYDGVTFNAAANGLTTSHVYTAAGTYTVAFQVSDDQGHSSIDTAIITITDPVTPPPPVVIDGTTVTVTGNASTPNTIDLRHNRQGQIVLTLNGVAYAPFATGGKFVIYGGDGDDLITGGRQVMANLEIYGGAGNDTITGGGMDDILVGGDGDDLITAGVGRDILIGGAGADNLNGKAGQDIVIAGSTSFDADPVALRAIQAEWTSGSNFNKRVANLVDGTGTSTRLNGSYFLKTGQTIFDDAAVDTLNGGGGRDWLIFNATGSGVLDVLTDTQGNNLITDL